MFIKRKNDLSTSTAKQMPEEKFLVLVNLLKDANAVASKQS